MVVDDDPNATALMSALLSAMDIQVKEAHSGREALQYILDEPPGFVVLDLMMPGMDGFEVLSRLQLNPRTRDVPVLILTGAYLGNVEVPDMHGSVIGVVRKGEADVEQIGQMIYHSLTSSRSL